MMFPDHIDNTDDLKDYVYSEIEDWCHFWEHSTTHDQIQELTLALIDTLKDHNVDMVNLPEGPNDIYNNQ